MSLHAVLVAPCSNPTSGVETISHLRDNGRITILFCAFEGPPRIARLFGIGEVFEFGTPTYDQYIPPANRRPGSRAVIRLHVHKVGSSCGYAVPFYTFERHRVQLLQYAEKLEVKDRAYADGAGGGEELERDGEGNRVKGGLKAYWATKNLRSIDGLAGLRTAFESEKPPLISAEAVSELQGSDGSRLNGHAGVKTAVKRSGILEGRFTDEAKLVLAFSLGIAVSAVYFKAYGAL